MTTNSRIPCRICGKPFMQTKNRRTLCNRKCDAISAKTRFNWQSRYKPKRAVQRV